MRDERQNVAGIVSFLVPFFNLKKRDFVAREEKKMEQTREHGGVL